MSSAEAPAQGAMELVHFARGVAVYETPARVVENGALVPFAERAMSAAATTAVPDRGGARAMTPGELRARFHARVPAAAQTLRVEAIVVHSSGTTVRVEADVLADGRRVADFQATFSGGLEEGEVAAAGARVASASGTEAYLPLQ